MHTLTHKRLPIMPGPCSCKFKALANYVLTPAQFPRIISSFSLPSTPMYANPRWPLWFCAFLSSCPFSCCSYHTRVCPNPTYLPKPDTMKILTQVGVRDRVSAQLRRYQEPWQGKQGAQSIASVGTPCSITGYPTLSNTPPIVFFSWILVFSTLLWVLYLIRCLGQSLHKEEQI